MHEIDEKADRLARLAHAQGLGGVLLNTQPNFAWLTGGRSNRIDGSRENGGGSLLVSAGGDRYVIANNIEMPRLQQEALEGLGFRPSEYLWIDEQADAGRPIEAAREVLKTSDIGCDGSLPGGKPIESQIAGARALLTEAELDRYRSLGRDVGSIVGEFCRELMPNLEEVEIARRLSAAVACVGARAVVTLVAADDRIARFRHPVPTSARWSRVVLVAICAQRQGLTVALSRLVAAGRPEPSLTSLTEAAAKVFGRLVHATTPGATGADLFDTAAQAYADLGFAGEETRHHQGGAIGYRAREWVAHPGSRETVQRRQAFAWNPTITGTKIEDTALIVDDEVEILTSSPGWPAIPLSNGHNLSAAGILRL
jgi:Xaa-Pro dipeptidase